MQQVKIFQALEVDADRLEKQINQWLQANPSVRVLQISGNIAPQSDTGRGVGMKSGSGGSDILVVMLYEVATAGS